MAGIIITTDLTPKGASKLAREVARDLEFSITRLDDQAFQATKGSLASSIFLGAFVLYCNFEVEIQDSRYEGEVDIIINRNIPWWTGLIGLRRVKTRAKELATAIADAIKQDGNQVLKKKEF